MGDSVRGIMLDGLNGSNPLGFLAAVGTAVVASDRYRKVRIGWKQTDLGWRPLLDGVGDDRNLFSKNLLQNLKDYSMDVFCLDDAMPFGAEKFAEELKRFRLSASMSNRRNVDLLAGMGTEIYPDKKTGAFQDTKLRMIRSGDSAGNGLPAYARHNREHVDLDSVKSALFEQWDYRGTGRSLRWDPVEDQRYALRWSNPSKPSEYESRGTMTAANDLAVEAWRLLPTLGLGRKSGTVGFQTINKRQYFIWPIWMPLIEMNTLRSLLSLPALKQQQNAQSERRHRDELVQMGVEEVYCSQCVKQNQYYQNFLPAHPV